MGASPSASRSRALERTAAAGSAAGALHHLAVLQHDVAHGLHHLAMHLHRLGIGPGLLQRRDDGWGYLTTGRTLLRTVERIEARVTPGRQVIAASPRSTTVA